MNTDQQSFLNTYLKNFAKTQGKIIREGKKEMNAVASQGTQTMDAAKIDLPQSNLPQANLYAPIFKALGQQVYKGSPMAEQKKVAQEVRPEQPITQKAPTPKPQNTTKAETARRPKNKRKSVNVAQQYDTYYKALQNQQQLEQNLKELRRAKVPAAGQPETLKPGQGVNDLSAAYRNRGMAVYNAAINYNAQVAGQVSEAEKRVQAAQAERQAAEDQLHALVLQLPEEEKLEVWIHPGYRLNKEEERQAIELAIKRIQEIDQQELDAEIRYGISSQIYNEIRNQLEPQRQKYAFLQSKSSDGIAVMSNAADAVPFYTDLHDWLQEKSAQQEGWQYDSAYNQKQTLSQQRMQSPVASKVGALAGDAAVSYVGGKLLQALPGAKAAFEAGGKALAETKTAQAINKVPVIGGLATPQAIENLLSGEALDLALNTVPSAIQDTQLYFEQQNDAQLAPQNKMQPGDIVRNALGNIAGDTLSGLGSELAEQQLKAALEALKIQTKTSEVSGIENAFSPEYAENNIPSAQALPVDTLVERPLFILEREGSLQTQRNREIYRQMRAGLGLPEVVADPARELAQLQERLQLVYAYEKAKESLPISNWTPDQLAEIKNILWQIEDYQRRLWQQPFSPLLPENFPEIPPPGSPAGYR